MSIFRAVAASDVGVRLFDLVPGPISIGIGGVGDAKYFDLQRGPLTPEEVTDLQSGRWWVAAVTPAFPDGEIRGQIMPVPEPDTWVLFLCGATGLALVVRRTFRSSRCRHEVVS